MTGAAFDSALVIMEIPLSLEKRTRPYSPNPHVFDVASSVIDNIYPLV